MRISGNAHLISFRLTEVASSGLVELQNRTRAGLEYAVSQQTVSILIACFVKLTCSFYLLLARIEILYIALRCTVQYRPCKRPRIIKKFSNMNSDTTFNLVLT